MSQRKQSQFSAEALQESAKRQVAEVLHTGEDAVTSGAWIYPIRVSSFAIHQEMSGSTFSGVQGIIYMLSRESLANLTTFAPLIRTPRADPSLLQPMIPTLLKAAAAAVGVIIAMFFFTYLPQVAVLAIVTGPLGMSS